MEYTLLVVDHGLDDETIIEGYTTSAGMTTALRKFSDMNRKDRESFMWDLITKGSAEKKGKRGDIYPYSIYATNSVGTMVRNLGAKE
ncbi:hypothetical protein SEA_ENDAVE_81 [Gordonia phage EndAve]|nr:hypothetical protein SEA_ENDAVE_81 [Gordonia phage EndAve]